MHQLVDTHAHLEEIAGLEEAIVKARAADIIAIITVGSDYESNQKVLELAQTHEGFIYPALGWHPCRLEISAIDHNLAFIEANIDKAVALGEVGLDYHKRVRAIAAKDLQKSVLKELLKIAKTHEKPAIIHSRYAWRDALTIVEEAQIEKAVFHWYTGPLSILRDIVSQGHYISATPAVEYHEEHRRAIKEIPLERLLLETDSPVVYRRGSELEYEARPDDILRGLSGAAELHHLSKFQVAEATTNNALKYFCLEI